MIDWLKVASCDTAITLLPGEDSKMLHQISKGTCVRAWLSPTKVWNEVYRSLLISSINEVEIQENTAGFYVADAFGKEEAQRDASERVENI